MLFICINFITDCIPSQFISKRSCIRVGSAFALYIVRYRYFFHSVLVFLYQYLSQYFIHRYYMY